MTDRRRNIGIPAGVVFPFAGNTAPYGYLICDGTAISRIQYPQLFLTLGISHGVGDGVTTFNLPDYRGMFLRGKADGSTNDPDRATRTDRGDGVTGDNVGTKQASGLGSHDHGLTQLRRNGGEDNASSLNVATFTGLPSITQRTNFTGGNETRPINISVNYIIKI